MINKRTQQNSTTLIFSQFKVNRQSGTANLHVSIVCFSAKSCSTKTNRDQSHHTEMIVDVFNSQRSNSCAYIISR